MIFKGFGVVMTNIPTKRSSMVLRMAPSLACDSQNAAEPLLMPLRPAGSPWIGWGHYAVCIVLSFSFGFNSQLHKHAEYIDDECFYLLSPLCVVELRNKVNKMETSAVTRCACCVCLIIYLDREMLPQWGSEIYEWLSFSLQGTWAQSKDI